MPYPRPLGHVALLSDFGQQDPYAGILRGAVLAAAPRALIVDLTHEVPPQDIATGAMFLAAAIGRFPKGTVFDAVVDPGVGTPRRPLAIATDDAYWIGPDNGLFSLVLEHCPDAEIRSIDRDGLRLGPLSATFHGRDLFAPSAGMLATGRYGFAALGPRVSDPVRLPATGDETPRVVWVDRFGSLITNVRHDAAKTLQAVEIAGARVPLQQTYGDVDEGETVALFGSSGHLEIAVRNGSAARKLGIERGADIVLHSAG